MVETRWRIKAADLLIKEAKLPADDIKLLSDFKTQADEFIKLLSPAK